MKVMSSKNDELVRETPREKPKRGLAKDYDTHPYPFSDVLLLLLLFSNIDQRVVFSHVIITSYINSRHLLLFRWQTAS